MKHNCRNLLAHGVHYEGFCASFVFVEGMLYHPISGYGTWIFERLSRRCAKLDLTAEWLWRFPLHRCLREPSQIKVQW